MQAFLSVTLNTIVIASVVYFSIGLTLSLKAQYDRPKEFVNPLEQVVNKITATETWFEPKPVIEQSVVPFVRPALPATRDGLRSVAKARGIPGWSKMLKADLILALG